MNVKTPDKGSDQIPLLKGTRDSIVKKIEWARTEAEKSAERTRLRNRDNDQKLGDCVRELKALSPTLRNLQLTLLKYQGALGDLLPLLEKETGHKLILQVGELKEYVQDACVQAVQGSKIEFQKNGNTFLTGIISNLGSVNLRHFHKLADLEQELVRRGYGDADVATMYVIFACLQPNAVKGSSIDLHAQDVMFDKLVRIVENQLKLDPVTVQEEAREGKGFFNQLARCLGVYADISQDVIRRSPQTAEKIRGNAERFLSVFLQSLEREPVRRDKRDSPTDPFRVLQTTLKERSDENPWLTDKDNLKDTPFDDQKFWTLITPDVPRGLLAEAIVGLNNYKVSLLAQRARILKSAADGAAKAGVPLAKEKVTQCEALITEYRALMPENAKSTGAQSIIDSLSDIEKLDAWRTKDELKRKGDIHPIAALLRIVDPQKVVARTDLRTQFLRLFGELRVPDASDTTTLDLKQRQQAAIIAASLRAVLDSDDPNLDVPLLGVSGDESLRTLFTDFAGLFDNDIRTRGPYVHLDGPRSLEEPLYTPIDIKEMTIERMESLKRNFDTAGVGSPREWIQAAAKAMCKRYDYPEIIEFARKYAARYYGTGNMYDIAFYRSGTGAMADVVGNLMNIKRGDRVIISNQEYPGMTKQFTKRGVDVARCVVSMNDRDAGKSLSIDDVFKQYKEIIDAGELPKAILLSSKTRYGDAPLTGDSKRPNSFGIRRLISLIKAEYPTICIVVDACQSFGRNDAGENNVQQLGCDVLINSGAKAAGVPEAATLLLRTQYPDDRNWLQALDEEIRKDPSKVLLPGEGTDNSQSIASMGIAMQMYTGRVNTWGLDPIGEKSSLRQAVAEHHKRMTEYCVEMASLYHVDLFTDPNFPELEWGSIDKADAKHAEQFGCHVVYPVHRIRENYFGIVSVTFPNIGFMEQGGDGEAYRTEYLKKKLADKKFVVWQGGPGGHEIRLSFNSAQDPSDIDELFKTIKEVHIDYLRSRIQKKGIRTFEELQKETSNVANDWMPN